MGNFLSGFDMDRDGSPRFFEDSVYETRNRPFLTGEENYEDFSEYSNITATVFVIVMIILLLVLLICCVKTVLVCRRQKRVNDQRRRMMQRDNAVDQSALPTDPNILNQSFLRAFTFDHHHHRIELPGGYAQNGHVMLHHDYNDQPPAYDQVIGLPPSYDSIVILNGTVHSRATSVVGSVRNSVLDTVRSLRRGSRGSAVRLDIAPGANQSDGPATMITGATSGPSEIGSTKSESLVTSVSNALVVHRQSMEPNHSEPLPTQVKRTKSLRKPKSEEDEESLTT
jgi:hypothetical protein